MTMLMMLLPEQNREKFLKKLDIFLLFDYSPVKRDYRFNKSKVKVLENLVIFKTLLLVNMDEFMLLCIPKKLLFF